MGAKTAMDQAVAAAEKRTVERMNAIREAERVVRPWVGDIPIAHDSAAGVFKSALDALGVDLETGTHPTAYRAILLAQPKPGEAAPKHRIAMDAAGAKQYNERFPNAGRLSAKQ